MYGIPGRSAEALVSVKKHCLVMWHSHSSSHPKEVSAATKDLCKNCRSRFCSRDENQGLLSTSGNLASFLHSFTRRNLEEACAEKPPQSGGLVAQRGERSPCPCLTMPRGDCKGIPLTASLAGSCKELQPFQLYVKHNGCYLLQWILSCWDKWHGLLGSCPKNW